MTGRQRAILVALRSGGHLLTANPRAIHAFTVLRRAGQTKGERLRPATLDAVIDLLGPLPVEGELGSWMLVKETPFGRDHVLSPAGKARVTELLENDE